MMTKHLKFLIVLLAAVTITFMGCKKEESDTSKMSFQLKSQTDLGLLFSSAIPGLTWTMAELNMSNFKVILKKGGVEKFAMEENSRIRLNLMNYATFFEITFPRSLEFDEVETRIMMSPSTEYIPLTLKATIGTPGGNTVPVEFYFEDAASIELKATNIKDNGSNYTGVINFEISRLLSSLDPSAFLNATRTDGKIVISKTSNADLYNVAKAALNTSYSIEIK